jgi:hypothetical protein
MAVKYSNIFDYKALQNLPKLVFLDTIWQPWTAAHPLSGIRGGRTASRRWRSTSSWLAGSTAGADLMNQLRPYDTDKT